MSIARHHAEWLSLVPVSGPFLSLPVLMEAFNAGLEPHDPDQSRLLRQEYGKWQESIEKRKADPAPHQHWIKFVLTNTLELDDQALAEGQAIPQTLQVEVPEHHELLRPSIVLIDPSTKKPRMLVKTYPRSQELTSYVANSHWKASPDTRMTELLHATGVRLGLVTNGEHWMLVDGPKGETTGYASWYASLWLEEPITLRAFRSLLSGSRFFNVPDDKTLEALLTKSASNQQEVTDQLGFQVRRAVEVLIHSLDRADQDFDRELLAGVREEALYESALTVMMRLVFLFCAEERELIPSKPFPVYEQNYSVSTISKQLRELADQLGEELLERRRDAWPRLLAAFRAVYGGLQHDDVHIPAYGGSLFNPDRFPFLEGRKLGTSWRDTEAHPLPVNNRTVLHLLEALQLLQLKVPGGGPAEARRLSFRALDIEQIGHVYEGLLDHTAKRATEPFLGLAGTRAKEPELPLAELETLLAKGESDLVKFLKEETGKSDIALKKSLKAEIDPQDATRFRTACQGDEALWKRVQRLAGLVRVDNFGYPVVIPKGSVFVTAGTDRRSSGTHYTPRSLTETIVQYTLEPSVYVGPAEGLSKDQWKLRSAKELLALKICDMACGSGAFLVQACRYMAARLLEAWDAVQRANPGTVRITPKGEPSTGQPGEMLIPDDPDERQTFALRIVAQRCLYGADKNPLAAEMAKLSLWLLTLAKDRPFEFLDHAIRCGDSLVGIHNLDQLRKFNLDGTGEDNSLFLQFLDPKVKEAIALRRQITEMQANTVEDVEAQDRMLREAEEKIDRLKYAADMLIAAEFIPGSAADKRTARVDAAIKVAIHFNDSDLPTFRREAQNVLGGQVTFHWPLELPEVMVVRGGFDAFIGNPPFVGGKRLGTVLGPVYQSAIKSIFADSKGAADLCGYFFRRATTLLHHNGCFGLLATNTIAQGDTKQVALDHLVNNGVTIYRAHASRPWPGVAGVCVAVVFGTNGKWDGAFILDEQSVPAISSALTSEVSLGPAHALLANKGFIAEGIKIHGNGFILSAEERERLVQANPRNDTIIQMYIGGEDVATSPTQESNRFVINFRNWEKEQALEYPDLFNILTERVKPYRDSLSGQIHETRYWLFWDRRESFFHQLKDADFILVCSGTAKYLAPVFIPSGRVLSQKLKVFRFQGHEWFSILQSDLHDAWVRRNSSTLGETLSYSNSDAFLTFPMPEMAPAKRTENLEQIGVTFHTARAHSMRTRSQGITELYNRFHDPDETSADIQKLRQLHVEMDNAVAAAYRWTNLELGHGFHETKQGVRFTINEAARREVLQRLLKLNHERFAEEVKQGLHDKKGAAKKTAAKKKAASKSVKEEATLFDMKDDDE
jgi:hypothetical protein